MPNFPSIYLELQELWKRLRGITDDISAVKDDILDIQDDLSDGVSPSGPAGGVLTGSYPNPNALRANSSGIIAVKTANSAKIAGFLTDDIDTFFIQTEDRDSTQRSANINISTGVSDGDTGNIILTTGNAGSGAIPGDIILEPSGSLKIRNLSGVVSNSDNLLGVDDEDTIRIINNKGGAWDTPNDPSINAFGDETSYLQQGQFTPELSGLISGSAYPDINGYYSRTGNLVHIKISIKTTGGALNTVGFNASAKIEVLPFLEGGLFTPEGNRNHMITPCKVDVIGLSSGPPINSSLYSGHGRSYSIYLPQIDLLDGNVDLTIEAAYLFQWFSTLEG